MNLLLTGESTERLMFRSIKLTDFNGWLEFFKHPASHAHWTAEKFSPEQECSNWYVRQQQRYENDEGGMNALIEKTSGRLVGHCGLLRQTVDEISEVEIGYSLLPEFWNKGYATEAAIKCRDHASAHKLSPTLISIISVTNLPSEKVATKVGMSLDKTTDYKGNRVNIFRVTSFDA
jgi:ribosomal-protein-alanine N-acetyltransferase